MTDFNSHTSAEEVCNAFSAQIKGKTFLITGTSAQGMGAKYAQVLARHEPAQLLLVARSQANVDPVLAAIHQKHPHVDARFVACELSDQASVRQAAASLLDDTSVGPIHVVINNAGVMAIRDYTVDPHGHELQLSTNHLGHFLLTNLLLPKILAAAGGGAGARIVNITSHGHRISPFRFDDPDFLHRDDGGAHAYDPWTGYGQAKTANILFSTELSRRLAPRGVRSFAVHPGLILTTGLADHLDFAAEVPAITAVAERNNPGGAWRVAGHAKDESQGCASALVAALDPAWAELAAVYVQDCQAAEPEPYAVDADNARQLWAYSEGAVGQTFDV